MADNLSHVLLSRVFTIHLDLQTGEGLPRGDEGRVLTREEFNQVVAAVQRFFDNTPDEEIRAFNGSILARPTTPPSHEGKSGWVYLARNRRRQTKIGSTGDLKKRIKALNNGQQGGVQLIFKSEVTNARQVEQELHAKYGPFRVWGEWFNLDDQQVNEIKEALGG